MMKKICLGKSQKIIYNKEFFNYYFHLDQTILLFVHSRNVIEENMNNIKSYIKRYVGRTQKITFIFL